MQQGRGDKVGQLEMFHPGPHYLPVHLLFTFRSTHITPRSEVSQCQQLALSDGHAHLACYSRLDTHTNGMLCLSAGLEDSYSALTCVS